MVENDRGSRPLQAMIRMGAVEDAARGTGVKPIRSGSSERKVGLSVALA
jgi:hypothetical protein